MWGRKHLQERSAGAGNYSLAPDFQEQQQTLVRHNENIWKLPIDNRFLRRGDAQETAAAASRKARVEYAAIFFREPQLMSPGGLTAGPSAARNGSVYK
jgi:hypothetical protein